MEDLVLDSGVYRIGRFRNAVTQLQVARRLTPVLVKMVPLVEAVEKMFPAGLDGPAASTSFDLKALVLDLEPFAQALSDLPDDKFEYIVNACLDVTHRQSGAGGGFAPVRQNGVDMFNDMTPADVVRIIFAAIQENLANFTSGLTSGSSRQ